MNSMEMTEEQLKTALALMFFRGAQAAGAQEGTMELAAIAVPAVREELLRLGFPPAQRPRPRLVT